MMKAKMQMSSVKRIVGSNGDIIQEEILAYPVCGGKPFGPNGESEDNTYARFTPGGSLTLTISNPDLFGRFKPMQMFYVDFTEANE